MSNHSEKLPTLAIVAATLAFLGFVAILLASIRQPPLLFAALVPLWAGIGILMRRTWSAYGFALYQAASVLSIPLIVTAGDSLKPLAIGTQAVVGCASALVFLFAGKSLSRSGAKRGFVWPWIALATLTSVPFIFLHNYLIPTAAMQNTLLPGDRVTVRIFPRASVRDGDLVVFHYPMDRRQIFVKRVIGMHGDHIRIASKIVYRNGVKLAEPYVIHLLAQENRIQDDFPLGLTEGRRADELSRATLQAVLDQYLVNGELAVPQGKYFVLGDNRDESLDSRHWGLLDEADVIGKPIVIYYSAVPSDDTRSMPRTRWDRLMKFL